MWLAVAMIILAAGGSRKADRRAPLVPGSEAKSPPTPSKPWYPEPPSGPRYLTENIFDDEERRDFLWKKFREAFGDDIAERIMRRELPDPYYIQLDKKGRAAIIDRVLPMMRVLIYSGKTPQQAYEILRAKGFGAERCVEAYEEAKQLYAKIHADRRKSRPST